MTLVDSADSVLMLYSYSGFSERSFAFFEKRLADSAGADAETELADASSNDALASPQDTSRADDNLDSSPVYGPANRLEQNTRSTSSAALARVDPSLSALPNEISPEMKRSLLVKQNTMSGLSIALTLVSILVAFRYAACFSRDSSWRSGHNKPWKSRLRASLTFIAYRSILFFCVFSSISHHGALSAFAISVTLQFSHIWLC